MAVSEDIQKKVLEEAYSVTPNYDVNYNDSRFGQVESDKQQALTELEQTYAGMIGDVDKYYNDQAQLSKEWADKQSQLQQDRTDFTIEKIEQQKEQANKDYIKEQSAAYVDWQKQSNQYGVNAEKMALAGLTNTGFSESSQVSMYNTYQNRVATARESLNQAILNYNNSIKDAMLQNNAALAEIAYETLIKQSELALAGFQYKNQLIIDQANKKLEIDNMYYNRYQDVLEQINKENALAEEIRQYNESMAWETEQKELDRAHQSEQARLDREFEEEQARIDREFKSQEAELDRQYSAAQAEINRKFQEEQAELDRKHDKEMLDAKNQQEKERIEQQHKNDMAKLKQQQSYEMAQLDKQLANEKALLSYKNSLEKQSVGSVSGSSGGKVKQNLPKLSGSNPKNQVSYSNGGEVSGSTFTGSTYKEAVAYMKKNGVSSAKASAAMTESEWSRRKNAGSTAAEVKYNKSYKEYITGYVKYCISNK